jgi:hypothetical protein
MLRLGYKVKEGHTVKTDYCFNDFDVVIEKAVAKQDKKYK